MGRVELQRLTKRYGALLANDAIDLTLNPGEIHALLGANGAGKTTLVNILAGTLPATSGQVLVPGRLRVVHQHFRLVETFTVAENIMLGREPGPGFILDGRRGRALAREAAERFGLDLDPDAVVADLPVGARQRVEVVKALVDDADWLVLDEPTAVLRPAEIDHLMGVLDRLRKAGRGILLITHKLAEATAIADRITVLRQGRVVAEVAPDIPHSELAELVVGSQAVVQPAPARHSIGPVVVSTHGLDVRAGEVVGLAGMPGAGQAGVVAAVLTAHPGAAHIPQDRQAAGFVAELPIATNLVLNRLGEFTRRGLLRRDQITATAQRLADEYGISTPVAAPAATLSGGNQQRLVLARELSLPRQVVVACEPTRGLDVAAVGFVHQQLRRARDGGAAVLLVSSDADELALLADRVVETSEVLDAS